MSSRSNGLPGCIHCECEGEWRVPAEVCRCDALAVIEQGDGSRRSRAQSTGGEGAIHGDVGSEGAARGRGGTQGENVGARVTTVTTPLVVVEAVQGVAAVAGGDGVLSRRKSRGGERGDTLTSGIALPAATPST